MNFIRKIKWFDTFGIPIQVTFNTEPLFKSQLGAIASIVMYTLSLIYAIYIIEEWINWKILPKVQTQIHTIRYTAVKLEEGDITIGYFNNTIIDPFSKTDNILTPILMKLNNTNLEIIGPYFSELRDVNYAADKRPTVALPALDLTLTKGQNFSLVQEQNNYEISYMLIISICNEKYLTTNASCASKEKIQDFLNTAASQLDFNVNLKQYNIQTQQFEVIQKSLYFAIQTQNRLFAQMMLKTTNQTVDTGVVFNNLKSQTYIDDFNVVTEYLTAEFQKRFGTDQFLMQFFIKLDNFQTIQSVAYNKLGEILAQIGSIVQLLLLVKYGIFYFNQSQLSQQLLEDIISYQFPEFSNLYIEKNIFGKILKVSKDDLQYQVSDYYKFLDQAKLLIGEKMDINHIVKEIMAIQNFILNTFNVCTSVPGRYEKQKKEFTRSQLGKIFPSSEDVELKSNNGCLSQQFSSKLQVEQIS